jgi:sugar phosphate isomerase/epimerase
MNQLSLNQATVKKATLEEAIVAATAAGIPAIGTWREPVADVGIDAARRMIADSGLRVSTHCRGGFLTAMDAGERGRALDDNRTAIDEARALADAGADGSRAVLVLVVGGLPEGSKDISGARERVADGIGDLVSHAKDLGVQLAIEPLHPMYASDRSVIGSLRTAVDIAERFPAEVVGVTVDAFHIWWDADAIGQIARAGSQGRIASFQVCDWQLPIAEDPLLSRHYPGDGVADLRALTRAALEAGYDGDIEVEIFNQSVWDDDPTRVALRCVETFEASVGPELARWHEAGSAVSTA